MKPRKKPECKYGAECYRKNKDHVDKFSHPDATEADPSLDSSSTSTAPQSNSVSDSGDQEILKEQEEPVAKKARISPEKAASPSTSSVSEENIPKLTTLEDKKKFIAEKFLVTMPPDFYHLWELASQIKPNKPEEAFWVDGLNLKLGGAFDVLSNKLEGCEGIPDSDFLIHARFPLDPPEFLTLIFGDTLHYGYLRDDPSEPENWVTASNRSSLEMGTWSQISVIGDNLFSLLGNVIIDALKKKKSAKVEGILKQLQSFADAKKYSMQAVSEKVKKRKKKIVAKSLHGGGIVVPMKGEVGYRDLPESDGDLKKLLTSISASKDEEVTRKKMEKIEEMMTYIQFANDECDYGMGLELGIDLFTSGYQGFHPEVKQLLSVAYLLLKRREWTRILDAHLPVRWQRSLASIMNLREKSDS